MKAFGLLSLLTLLFSTNCEALQTLRETITYDGVTRSFIIYVPAIYSNTDEVPLLLGMHKKNGTAENFMTYGDFRYIADTANFIIVHPQGLLDKDGITHWNFNPSADTVDDIGFLDSLIENVSSRFSIDQKRIYSTGFSQGAFMSFYLACHLERKIAGIGAVSGSLIDTAGCFDGFPVPIMQIHGTNDNVVSYNAYKIPGIIDICVNYNGCDATPTITNMPDIDKTDGSSVTQFLYENGKNGISVEHLRVNNGEHKWPGNGLKTSNTNYDIVASVEIWRFLSQFNSDGRIATSSALSLNTPKAILFPNPTSGTVKLTSNHFINSISVKDMQGKELLFKVLNASSKESILSTESLPSNMYTVTIHTDHGIEVTKLLKL